MTEFRCIDLSRGFVDLHSIFLVKPSFAFLVNPIVVENLVFLVFHLSMRVGEFFELLLAFVLH